MSALDKPSNKILTKSRIEALTTGFIGEKGAWRQLEIARDALHAAVDEAMYSPAYRVHMEKEAEIIRLMNEGDHDFNSLADQMPGKFPADQQRYVTHTYRDGVSLGDTEKFLIGGLGLIGEITNGYGVLMMRLEDSIRKNDQYETLQKIAGVVGEPSQLGHFKMDKLGPLVNSEQKQETKGEALLRCATEIGIWTKTNADVIPAGTQEKIRIALEDYRGACDAMLNQIDKTKTTLEGPTQRSGKGKGQ